MSLLCRILGAVLIAVAIYTVLKARKLSPVLTVSKQGLSFHDGELTSWANISPPEITPSGNLKITVTENTVTEEGMTMKTHDTQFSSRDLGSEAATVAKDIEQRQSSYQEKCTPRRLLLHPRIDATPDLIPGSSLNKTISPVMAGPATATLSHSLKNQ